ncbi:hypothetical protein CFK39_02335 [Brachybacterium avium]|uniref:Uncharacterized protein n=1 Tax=Brachybacterium avium TaxID=2017485 RepID=A0A220UAE9_9MICO|nr:hypothetical protein CFK39_02335 [Brachybacterium avium]
MSGALTAVVTALLADLARVGGIALPESTMETDRKVARRDGGGRRGSRHRVHEPTEAEHGVNWLDQQSAHPASADRGAPSSDAGAAILAGPCGRE